MQELLEQHDALGLGELVKKGEVSAIELLDASLEKAEEAQGKLNCFTRLWGDMAREQIDSGLADGPFQGVPFYVKDLGVHVKGQPMTSGSVGFKDFVCEYDSELAKRWKAAGLVLAGQTTSPEFGLTTTTESALYGNTRNPWDLERSSGGSSGGASSAVAGGVAPMAHASDGGGSIRIPAACTGLFGMKPSRGRIPFGPNKTEGWYGLSCNGAVTRSVRDSAALMDATCGYEGGARYTALETEGTYLNCAARDPKSLKIAMWEHAPSGVKPDGDVSAALDKTVKLLESLGHKVELATPKFDGDALGRAMITGIASEIANAFTTRAEAMGRELRDDDMEPVTRRFFELGNTMPARMVSEMNAHYQMAAGVFDEFMADYDVILASTLMRVPERLGVMSLSPSNFDEYSEAVSTYSANCAIFNQMGCPAMSVPLEWSGGDWDGGGLPIGIMFGALHGREDLLFSLAGQLERAHPWFHKRAKL